MEQFAQTLPKTLFYNAAGDDKISDSTHFRLGTMNSTAALMLLSGNPTVTLSEICSKNDVSDGCRIHAEPLQAVWARSPGMKAGTCFAA